ncbi:196_t:CDS:2, partial [Entrophospora sp. SA101]
PGYSDQSIYSPEPLIIMTNELLNWDSLLSSIILSIQQLHNAAKENAKHDFIVCTNSIVERIRIMLYASGTIDKESYTIRENKNLKLFHRRIMASLSKLVLSTKIAAGVWPPPDSNQKLRNDVDEVLEAVQQFVQISKNIVEIRRVDPRILQSSYGGSWRGNNLRPMLTNNRHRRNPSLLLKYKSGSDSNGFAAPSQHLTDGLVISIDQNSKFIFKTINSLMSDINSIRDASLNNNASSKNINDMAQLFNQVHQIIKQSGQFLSMLEDIDLKDLDEYSQSFINEFEVAKQFIYNSIASLIIVIQASIDPLNQRDVLEELINSANIVEKSVKDVIIALKFLLEEKESRSLIGPFKSIGKYEYEIIHQPNGNCANNINYKPIIIASSTFTLFPNLSLPSSPTSSSLSNMSLPSMSSSSLSSIYPIKILGFSDNQYNLKTFNKIVKSASILHNQPNFILHVGDPVQKFDSLQQWQTDFFDPLINYKLIQKSPMIFAHGNHDFNPLLNYHYTTNKLWYSFTIANTRWIVLDSNIDDELQDKWLIKELSSIESKLAKFRIVVVHIPPFVEFWDPKSWNEKSEKYWGDFVRKRYVPLFQRYEVDLVISGHQHNYQRGQFDGTVYTIIGGAGGELDYERVEDWKIYSIVKKIHHYVLIEIWSDKLIWVVYDINNKVIDKFELGKRAIFT